MAAVVRRPPSRIFALPCCHRPFSSSAVTQTRPLAYISLESNPHFNLSLEHFLLRATPKDTPLCLLYQNDPCIVIGRNQNPWKELDVTRMRELGIRLVRRRSGGGAVYHDNGNTNYSFHIAREAFTRQQHAVLVARALNRDPISLKSGSSTDLGDATLGAYVNKRHDICISLKDRNPSERKISGSAYKIISSRAYHHGTMLLSSNLANLGSALKPSRKLMQSKGVESVPSPVSNLVDAFSSRKRQLNHSSFCSAVFEEFKRTYGDADMMSISEDNHIEVLKDQKGELHSGWNEMNSWDWIWGQTPEFSHRIRSEGIDEVKSAFEIALHVKNGIIRSAKVSPQKDEDLQSVVQRLEGTRYNVFADAPMTYGNAVEVKGMDELGLKESEGSRQMNIAKQLLQWLKTVL